MKRKKKSLSIGEAVFRGKKETYNFEIFPIDFEFPETSAVFIISHRKLDKFGKGHHKFSCIGQTDSIIKEIKKHKKSKCVKQHKANVICLLAEENEKMRTKIESDLRTIYRVPCPTS
jgi:hypothetical protein